MCQDILTADPLRFERPDLLWASPPCVTASIANQRTGETGLDRQLASAACGFIMAMLPPVVVLENVSGYRRYQSYAEIVTTLRGYGYHVRDWLLNAADYGIPQQRRRLIMIAARGFVPQRPSATHKRQADMFSPQWRGWYDAVVDLIPTFPQAQLANWQRRRLPAWLTETVLHMTGNTQLADPTGTGVLARAQLANTVRDYSGGGGLPTALLVRGDNAGQEWGKQYQEGCEPSCTVNGNVPRALLLDDQFSSAGGVHGNDRGVTSTDGGVPAFTITTRDSQRLKAVLLDHADVRSLTPRALARLQSVPDSYQLPEKRKIACSIIGRGVPCLLAQAIGKCVNALSRGA
jgi:DNA (cytosine-5)-methyltransferase 1